jgi:2-keto-4-pentenoate hydratase
MAKRIVSAMVDNTMVRQWAEELHAAWKSNSPKPTRNLAELRHAEAYQVQRQFLALRNDKIVGFKAGLTNALVQQRQGASEPAGGVLFANAGAEPNVTFHLSDFVQPRIETEIGFITATEITQPVKPEDLHTHLSHWFPMIEIVDMGFTSTHALTDLIASNVVASRFIKSVFTHELNTANQAMVSLFRNGNLLHEGKATDSLGDQFKAAAWIINSSLARGYSINPGHLLMTGALGVTHPPEQGNYRANYGDFGFIEFSFDE